MQNIKTCSLKRASSRDTFDPQYSDFIIIKDRVKRFQNASRPVNRKLKTSNSWTKNAILRPKRVSETTCFPNFRIQSC